MLYFDNAATTYPKPVAVEKAVLSAVKYYGGNPGRSGHKLSMAASEQIYSVRKKLADFFNADPQNVVFTLNCTMSTNMAIKGLADEGGHIICSCVEHNAVIRPLHKLSEKGLISYSVADVSGDDEAIVSSFERLITPKTTGIVTIHASNVTGKLIPIEKIGALCKKHGLFFVVDAAQSAGIISIDMKKSNITALCLPGHKGLYGIAGSGALILSGDKQFKTIIEGGTGSLSSDLIQPDILPDRFESGTVNTAGIISIGAGLDFINKIGIEKIHSHERKLCEIVYNGLKRLDNVILYENVLEKENFAPIVSFNIKGTNSERVAALLNDADIAVRGGLHCAPMAHGYYNTLDMGMVRFAPSAFSKEWEAAQFIKNITAIAKKIPISLEKKQIT